METEFGVEVQDSRSCEGDTRVVRNNYLNYLLYKPQGTNFILQINPLCTNGFSFLYETIKLGWSIIYIYILGHML